MQKREKITRRIEVCSCCGVTITEHPHTLSKGLVDTLIDFKKFVVSNEKNKVHPVKDLKLSNYEYNNMQKLRYFGLIARYINPQTKKNESGYWILTRNGSKFLKGLIDMPYRVKTMRNKISGKSTKRLFLSDILSSENIPYWDDYKTPVESEVAFYPNIYDVEEETPIYDANGQTKFFF
jgi:hypothetical protein